MKTRILGSAGRPSPPSVSVAWACSDLCGPADEAESIATIHAALDAGINLLDTGDYYAMGDNTTPRCRSRRRSERSARWSMPATSVTSGSRRSAPKPSAAPTRPVRSPTCRSSTHHLARDRGRDPMPTCRERGIGVTAYGVLSRGLLSDHWSKERNRPGGLPQPRTSVRRGENRSQPRARRRAARRRGVQGRHRRKWRSPGPARGDDVVPLVGARTRGADLAESLGALEHELSADDLGRDRGGAAPWTRWPAAHDRRGHRRAFGLDVSDPQTVARALFDATSRFHNPANEPPGPTQRPTTPTKRSDRSCWPGSTRWTAAEALA